MTEKTGHNWNAVVRMGLLGGIVAVYLCLVGLVGTFSGVALITGVIAVGHTLLLLAGLGAGFLAARRAPAGRGPQVLAGALAGLIAGAMLALLVIIGSVVNLRAVMLQASPLLYSLLTFNLGVGGFWVPLIVGGVLGAAAGLIYGLPPRIRQLVTSALAALVGLGLFAEQLRTPMLTGILSGLARFLFGPEGLTPAGALITLVLVVGGVWVWQQRGASVRQRISEMSDTERRTSLIALIGAGLIAILLLPLALGKFFAQVIADVARYVLMGLGLNITLGFAGLLDLGFVAFFAVGAYTVGLLTSTDEYGIAQWSWWAAAPFAIVLAMAFGAFLGLPILGMRGDYLAIATLGFGEIIRILAGSDLLKPILGGPRGILNIPKPIDVPPDHPLAGPNQIYYLALVCIVLAAFVAWRLRSSRLGRTWMAVREDEDVAEALGVNLVQTKLLAYMLGAAFAGLGGAIFAGLISNVFASSMQLLVSIYVVSLIIVGGMGSIPGVVVGAVFIIGLPGLLREFSEYLYLFYGAALIAMMLYKPEGLWPSRVIRRELHAEVENEMEPSDAAASGAAAP